MPANSGLYINENHCSFSDVSSSKKLPSLLWIDEIQCTGRRQGHINWEKDRQADTRRICSVIYVELLFFKGGSQESCVAGCARFHTVLDCLAAVPLLGERTRLQGGSWFEMVSRLTPLGDANQAELVLRASLFRSSGAWFLWGDGSRGGFSSWLWTAL